MLFAVFDNWVWLMITKFGTFQGYVLPPPLYFVADNHSLLSPSLDGTV
ncbi:unnamed protein product [Brassica oleracea]